MNIRHIQPFALDLNIGREYNRVISEQLQDTWIVIRDFDTLPLRYDWPRQVYDLIQANPDYDAFTCMTNRLGIIEHCVPGLFDEPDINKHFEYAWSTGGTEVEPTIYCTGNCMIFHKSTWEKFKFPENTVAFDMIWSDKLRAHGLKIGLAKGLYTFHLYRWGKENPRLYKKHLFPESK